MTKPIFRSLDLFSGCGGMSLGLAMAGAGSKLGGQIETVAAADIFSPACATFASNLGFTPYNAGVDKRLIRKILS